jgi:hypothetical protein
MFKKIVLLGVFIPNIGFSGITVQTCSNSLAGGSVSNEQVQVVCVNNVVLPDPFKPLDTLAQGAVSIADEFLDFLTTLFSNF